MDRGSASYLKYALNEIRDEETYFDLVTEAVTRAENFLDANNLSGRLEDKLMRAAEEYGNPYTRFKESGLSPKEYIRKELEEEAIDLIGYILLERWLERKQA